jgi:hypothetical protein
MATLATSNERDRDLVRCVAALRATAGHLAQHGATEDDRELALRIESWAMVLEGEVQAHTVAAEVARAQADVYASMRCAP